jgi:multidrug efflux pump subunit AcrA (membrane-fusion protein)
MWLSKDPTIFLKQSSGSLAWSKVATENSAIKPVRILTAFIGILLIVLFLPWTQTIFAPGIITARAPEQRPQEINAIIAGAVEKWYVREGNLVRKGDTILKLYEVKENYLDPDLLARTEQQIQAKERTLDFYRNKIAANQAQYEAVVQAKNFKLQQAKNKISQAWAYLQSDSILLVAANTELKIARDQYARQKELYDAGLKSLTELEQKKQALQNAESKKVVLENKLSNTGNDLINAHLEVNQIERDYNEKTSKLMSDRFSVLGEISTGEADVAKLKNQFSNYAIRNSFYYVLAPQAGQITRTVTTGVGEVVKEGEMLAMIVPEKFQYAVEMYVRPIDLPLLKAGQQVRFQFDGWPSVVFSGWPNSSYGTFGGRVVAVDNNISPNGKFRVLVAEDPADVRWPASLRIGGGAKGLVLLNDVPLGYELWRIFNGFPPEFYKITNPATNAKK